MPTKVKNLEDAIMKAAADIFKEDTLKFFGISKKIIAPTRTEIKEIEVKTSFLDYAFLMEDDTILHLEFQTTYKEKDLRRFRAYEASLSYKEDKDVTTLVVYSSNIKESNVKTALKTGISEFRITPFFMQSIDGDERLEEIQRKINSHEALTKQDMLNLIFIPIMNTKTPKVEVIKKCVECAKEVKDDDYKFDCLALIHSFADKLLSRIEKEEIRRLLMMTELGKMMKEEGVREYLIETTIDLLNQKFNKLPEGMEEKLKALDIEKLKTIQKNILVYTLEDVGKLL